MPILDEQTLIRFGYRITDIHPNSAKHVVYACNSCGTVLTRQRRRVDEKLLCHKCVIRLKRPTEAIEKQRVTMLERYGVDSPFKSKEIKQKIKNTMLARYGVENISSSPETQAQRRDWWADKLGEPPPLPENVLREETFKRYGYYPEDLTRGVSKPVILQCPKCLKIFHRAVRFVSQRVLCQRCLRTTYAKAHWDAIVEKRTVTMLERYGDSGIPKKTNIYGATQNTLAELISSWIGIPVRQEVAIGRKSLDIVIDSHKLAIEYCGLYWHSERVDSKGILRYGKNNHWNKFKLAQEHGLRLITIFENEWRERRPQVENVLKSILRLSSRRFQARQCTVSSINVEEARLFIGAHHIQPLAREIGFSAGLFAGDELLGVVTAGTHHRQGHEKTLILQRLCFKSDTYVMGGSERLFKPLIEYARGNGFSSIRTWSDNRWFVGDIYRKLGFQLTAEIPPDYSYVAPPSKLLSKQSQAKKRVACPAHLTEREWAEQRGLLRIWDCGKKRWDFIL